MSDTKTDSEDSVIFVGKSTNIKVTADVHRNPDYVPETPSTRKRRRILDSPTTIPETQGKNTFCLK